MTYTIAVDLDETLSNTMQAFFSLHNWYIGWKHFKREEITQYHISQIQWVLLTDAEQGAMTHKMFLEHPDIVLPIAGSLERLQERRAQGHRLYVVTWRPLIFEDLTRARVEKYFEGIFEDVFMCNYFFNQPVDGPQVSKAEYCKRINANVMIDDDRNYAIDTASHGIETFLIDRPRNQEIDVALYPAMKRVFGWDEIQL